MKILVVGGGSGGHITPAVAVVRAILAERPRAEIEFWTDRKYYENVSKTVTELGLRWSEQDADRAEKTEKELVAKSPRGAKIGRDSAGAFIRVRKIYAGKFRRYAGWTLRDYREHLDLVVKELIWGNIKGFGGFIAGLVQSFVRLLPRADRPGVIFLKGGYVGLPVGLVARALGIPYVIHESDAVPGLANRILMKRAAKVATGMPSGEERNSGENGEELGKITEKGKNLAKNTEKPGKTLENQQKSSENNENLRESGELLAKNSEKSPKNAEKWAKMGKNGENSPKNAEKAQNLAKNSKNTPKNAEKGKNLPKNTKNSGIPGKTAKNAEFSAKTAENAKILAKSTENDGKISKNPQKTAENYENPAENTQKSATDTANPSKNTRFVWVGTPVAPEFRPVSEFRQKQLKKAFGFDPEKFLVVVTGGSQGARTIDEAMREILPEMLKFAAVGLQVGAKYYDDFLDLKKYEKWEKAQLTGNFRMWKFVPNMAELLGAADVVVSRAGATTIAELAAIGKPAVLVPFERLPGAHQVRNAERLQSVDAVEVLMNARMEEQPGLLLEAVRRLARSPKRRAELARNLHAQAKPDAATQLAAVILAVAKGKD